MLTEVKEVQVEVKMLDRHMLGGDRTWKALVRDGEITSLDLLGDVFPSAELLQAYIEFLCEVLQAIELSGG